MYRKELIKKAVGVTIACMLTIGLNAALGDAPQKNVSESADRAKAVVVSTVDSDTGAKETVVLSAETVEPNADPSVTDLSTAATQVPAAATQAPAVGTQVAATATQAPVAATQAPQATAAPQKTARKKVSRRFRTTAISIAKDYVNIRKAPNTDSKIKGKLYRGSAAKILKTKGSWVKISSGSVTGYIRKDYLAIGAKAEKLADKYGKTYATVKKGTETLNVREKKSTDADIVTQIGDGESYLVKSENSKWVKIKLSGSDTGYVSKDYVSTQVRFSKAVSIQEEQAQQDSDEGSSSASSASGSSSSSSRGSSIARYALQFVGNPYVWGGTSLTHGADCSGFTMSVYAHFGYGLPHSSASQSGCGRAVSLSELQPGDLVFYKHGGSIGHVAMYIGGGRVVHAQCKRTGITTSSVNYNTPACARRIIG